MYSKKKILVKKVFFSSRYSSEDVNYRFEDPGKSSSPNVLDYFASCPKKMENILFQKQLSFRKMFFWTCGK